MSQYQQQLRAIIISLNFSEEPVVGLIPNFKVEALTLTIVRENLIVKLNTAPRIPPVVVKPSLKVTRKSNDVTIGNETSPNKNITTNKNLVSQVNIMHNNKVASPQYALEIPKSNFNYTVRPTVHTNQSRRRSFASEIFRLETFENVGFSFSCTRKTYWKQSSSKTETSR